MLKRAATIVVTASLCFSLVACRQSGETPQAEKKPPHSPLQAEAEDANLTIKPLSDTTFTIELDNRVPIRGIQCTIEGTRVTSVTTTSRSKNFLATFNESTGIIILMSMSGEKILPGNGAVIEVTCKDAAHARLTNVKLSE